MRNKRNNVKKRVAIFGNLLSSIGYNKSVCEDLAERLESQDWSVIRASSKLGKLPRLIDLMSTAWKRRNDYDYGVVDVFSGNAFLWAEAVCLILRLAKKPFVLTLHGGNLPDFSKKWCGRVRRLLNSAHSVTTPSNYLYEQMKPYRDDLVLIPNPIEIGSFCFKIRSSVSPRLIWLRSFHEMYNAKLAPQVLHLLTERGFDANLTMIGPDMGDGSLQNTKRLARKLNVISRINFEGRIPKSQVPDYLRSGDIFINTTNVDNTPVSVIEAMACGLCIVSTDVGGIPYLLQDETNALLVSPNNPEEMADAIQRIITETDLAERLSKEGRKKVEQFDWSKILPKWEELFHSLNVRDAK